MNENKRRKITSKLVPFVGAWWRPTLDLRLATLTPTQRLLLVSIVDLRRGNQPKGDARAR